MVSIVVPYKEYTTQVNECMNALNFMKYQDIEVICLSDDITGNIKPCAKRDMGIKQAKGEFVAFIDSDAYPKEDWLTEALKTFEISENIHAVCGPGVLPPNSSLMEQASDWVLRCLPYNYRVLPKKARIVKDFPSFNLIVRKSVLDKIGGFGCDYLTGEDTLLCQKIIDNGGVILYNPKVVVYHHRRPLFKPFLKQIATYGWHRGHFFRRGYGDSRKLVYLLPSLFLIGLVMTFVVYAVSFIVGWFK
jgi:cellulose synthase/poly-beta-1,6-N-acetylglucosamine synthase-like glycosyltransferase